MLLIHRLLRVAAGLLLAVTEQKLDEAAAHVGALGIGGTDRGGGLRRLIGEDHPGFPGGRIDRGGGMRNGSEKGRAGEQRKGGFPGH